MSGDSDPRESDSHGSGVSDTVALVMIDRSFTTAADASIAKIAVFVGSAVAALIGTGILARSGPRKVRF